MKSAENCVDLCRLQGVAGGEFLRCEWTAPARVAADEIATWSLAGGEEDSGESSGERSAEGVAVAASVFDGDEAGFAGDSNADGGACVGEIGDCRGDCGRCGGSR